MKKLRIAKGQVWKSKSNTILISGKKGGKWLAKVLTSKPDIYNGSHCMSETTIWKNFELL